MMLIRSLVNVYAYPLWFFEKQACQATAPPPALASGTRDTGKQTNKQTVNLRSVIHYPVINSIIQSLINLKYTTLHYGTVLYSM